MRWSRAWMSEAKLSSRSATNLHRPAHDLGNHRDGHLVRVDVHLDAVAAADVAADDAHGAERQPEMLGEHLLHHVRRLRRVVDGERAVALVEFGEDRARLQRHAGVAAGVEGRLDDLVRGLEGLGDVAALVDALEDRLSPRSGWMTGVALSSAVSMSATGGSICQAIEILATASSATARLSATTAATASPAQVAVVSGRGSCGADFMPLRWARTATQGSQCGARSCTGEDAQHARQLQRRARIDRADLRVRMRAAHERDMHHARQNEVVDVLPAPLDKLARIGSRDRSPDVGVRPVDGAGVDHLAHGLPGPPALVCPGSGHRLDGVDDGVIAGATTVVAREVLADCRARRHRAGLGGVAQQLGGGHQHARRAVAALAGVADDERILQVADFAGVGQAFDGLDGCAIKAGREDQAAAHDQAVHAHRAGAADAVLAARYAIPSGRDRAAGNRSDAGGPRRGG